MHYIVLTPFHLAFCLIFYEFKWKSVLFRKIIKYLEGRFWDFENLRKNFKTKDGVIVKSSPTWIHHWQDLQEFVAKCVNRSNVIYKVNNHKLMLQFVSCYVCNINELLMEQLMFVRYQFSKRVLNFQQNEKFQFKGSRWIHEYEPNFKIPQIWASSQKFFSLEDNLILIFWTWTWFLVILLVKIIGLIQ